MDKRILTKIIIIASLIMILPTIISCQTKDKENTFYVASWNVENLFDTYDDPQINDSEFLPESSKQWTDARFDKKISDLAKVINYMNDGCGPDILGLVEVENMNVAKLLAYKLGDRDYLIAHRDSPDQRGIDAALFFDRTVFGIVSVDTIHVNLPTGYNTRFILHVTLQYLANKSNVHFFVNHWPSRRGGEVKSEPNRRAAAMTLKSVVDSLLSANKNEQIIIMGDFNDEPNNSSINKILSAKDFDCSKKQNKSWNSLLNLSYNKFSNGDGSYLFGSNWNMIDQIIASPALIDFRGIDYICDSFEIIKPDFMITKTGNRIGGPLATYSGEKYLGGFSDHFPVGARFKFIKESN